MTDPGKTSKRGRLTLVKNPQGSVSTVRQKDVNGREDLMVTVFRYCTSPIKDIGNNLKHDLQGMEILLKSGPGKRCATGKTPWTRTTEIGFGIQPAYFIYDSLSYGPIQAKCQDLKTVIPYHYCDQYLRACNTNID